MKNIFTSLLAFARISDSAQSAQMPQTLDPKSIIFSVPTLSNDIAPTELVKYSPTAADLVFHEDEWSQIEFLPESQLPEVQRLLTEYKPFEQQHRLEYGWREVYVRKINRISVTQNTTPLKQLETTLGVTSQPAPFLSSSGSVLGQVQNGFSFLVGSGITLYGYVSGQSIPVLGVIVENNSDNMALINTFVTLNAESGLILVDWISQQVLVSVTASGQVDVWQP